MSDIKDDNKIAIMLLWVDEINNIRKNTEKDYNADTKGCDISLIDKLKLKRISREIIDYLEVWG